MRNSRIAAGFTLIEMMLVIVIIGILAAVVTAQLTGRAILARQTTTRALIKEVNGQVALFKLDYSRYPEKLEDLVFRPGYVDPEAWRGPYLHDFPVDGWMRDLEYRVPGRDGFPFDVVSYGADGTPGGTEFDEDLWNHARR